MEFRVLGKLEVVRDDESVDLGAFRQRALLALLLTAPNSVLSTDRILDELWGTDGGNDKQNALWVYVSGLRKALEPDRAKRIGRHDPAHPCARLPAPCGPEQIDSLRFERMVAEGRALVDVDPAVASRRARRGAGALARPALRGLHVRAIRPSRDRPSRRAAARSGRAPGRGRSRDEAWPVS